VTGTPGKVNRVNTREQKVFVAQWRFCKLEHNFLAKNFLKQKYALRRVENYDFNQS